MSVPNEQPVDVYLPALAQDPRRPAGDPPGLRVRRGPPLHPDDVTVLDGVPVTAPSRTLIDLAEELAEPELRAAFGQAQRRGLLDLDALRAARSRVEWRPSLALVDAIIADLIARG